MSKADITEARFAGIEKRLKAATPGPWEVPQYDGADKEFYLAPPHHVMFDYDDVDHDQVDADCLFIVHTPEDIADLIAFARSAAEVIKRAVAAYDYWNEMENKKWHDGAMAERMAACDDWHKAIDGGRKMCADFDAKKTGEP